MGKLFCKRILINDMSPKEKENQMTKRGEGLTKLQSQMVSPLRQHIETQELLGALMRFICGSMLTHWSILEETAPSMPSPGWRQVAPSYCTCQHGTSRKSLERSLPCYVRQGARFHVCQSAPLGSTASTAPGLAVWCQLFDVIVGRRSRVLHAQCRSIRMPGH
jgi:hypothetical protein